jgi:ATP-dependent helicase/DNAse subunit B
MSDKYSAVWVSHTSMSDFLKCPRSYYLKNVYKDPKTKHKIQLMAPPLALGQAVHDVLESLSILPTSTRLNESLIEKFGMAWERVSGKYGGFPNLDVEAKYRLRGETMLRRVMAHPGPVARPAVKIKEELPHYWLSPEEGIILCGKIDWLEYLPDQNAVNIVDFKTGKSEEDPVSLQLPIYHLLVHNCQKRTVAGAAYWYLDLNDTVTPRELPDLEFAHNRVLDVARQVKLARQLERFKCPGGAGGCRYCQPLESILHGEAEFVGANLYGQDVYILSQATVADGEESYIL